MPNLIRRLFSDIASSLFDEKGQDLVEYSLTFAVIALGSVAEMKAVAQGVNDAFLAVGNLLTTSIS
jgi:Flp pilus assembly pilin Flp